MKPCTDLSLAEDRLFTPIASSSGHILEDPATGLSHLLPQVKDAAELPSPNSNTIIVSIHGACKRNGQIGAKATYALYFSKGSKFNTTDYLPKVMSHKSQNAQLFACQRAIEVIEDVVNKERDGDLKTVILRTHSSYLVKCFSKYAFEWEKNGYLNAHGNPVINRVAVEKIQSLLMESARDGRATYQFWLVGKEDNSDAISLAKEAFKSEPTYTHHVAQPNEPWQAALSYWIDVAHTSAPAHNLCNRLGIQLRKGAPGIYASITPPIRRLVITGEDRPGNFLLLFGPEWEAVVLEEWKRIRADILDAARPKTKIDHILDMGTPWYRPRTATAAELRENNTFEGGVRLEPKVNRLLSEKEDDLTLEDWVDVLTIDD